MRDTKACLVWHFSESRSGSLILLLDEGNEKLNAVLMGMDEQLLLDLEHGGQNLY